MTLPLQDDAAERRIREIANSVRDSRSLETAIRTAWTEATEAAAKKCEAIGDRPAEMALSEGVVEAYDNACDDCAAAIRGKP